MHHLSSLAPSAATPKDPPDSSLSSQTLLSLTHSTSPAPRMPLLRALFHYYPFLHPSTSPSSAPSQPPSPSPFPKYPSSFTPLPFFPTYPSPPPPLPSSPSLPTFPANISSLTLPQPSHSALHHSSSKLLPSVLLPILALLLLSLSLLFIYLRRRRRRSFHDADDSRSDSRRLFSDAQKLATSSRPTSSEFLYLGTLVNSRGQDGEPQVPPPAEGSPELRPLPPLNRQVKQNFGCSDVGGSSEGDFYSPKASQNPRSSQAAWKKQVSKSSSSDLCLSSRSPSSPTVFTIDSLGSKQAPDGDGTEVSDKRSNLSAFLPPERRPPPPRPPVLTPPRRSGVEDNRRINLKPLHWDKVPANSNRTMLKSSSFQLNKEMIETLFVCNAASAGMKGRQQGLLSAEEENRVLDVKKSRNIAIMLKALNMSTEEACEALLEDDAESLSYELLETLQQMAPSKEEELKLKQYKDDSLLKLGPAENFLKAAVDIPFAFERVEAMFYIANFYSEVNYLKESFSTLEAACEELKNSQLFFKLLEARNQSNTLQDDQEFKRLGLQVNELTNVKKAAAMDCNALGCYSSKLAAGIEKIRQVVRLSMSSVAGKKELFHEAMRGFLKRAEGEILEVQPQERVALPLARELIEIFHGDLAKEEAHPLRIFMMVRDFLCILDQVCKEVDTTNNHTFVSPICHISMTLNMTSLPVSFVSRASRGP